MKQCTAIVAPTEHQRLHISPRCCQTLEPISRVCKSRTEGHRIPLWPRACQPDVR